MSHLSNPVRLRNLLSTHGGWTLWTQDVQPVLHKLSLQQEGQHIERKGSKQGPVVSTNVPHVMNILCHLVFPIATHCNGNHLTQDYRPSMHRSRIPSQLILYGPLTQKDLFTQDNCGRIHKTSHGQACYPFFPNAHTSHSTFSFQRPMLISAFSPW